VTENPLCQECETASADLTIPNASGDGVICICEGCLRHLFEKVMAEPKSDGMVNGLP